MFCVVISRTVPQEQNLSDARRIEITTLRDGTQGKEFNLSLQDKLLITHSHY